MRQLVRQESLTRDTYLVLQPFIPILEQKTAALDQVAPLQGWESPE